MFPNNKRTLITGESLTTIIAGSCYSAAKYGRVRQAFSREFTDFHRHTDPVERTRHANGALAPVSSCTPPKKRQSHFHVKSTGEKRRSGSRQIRPGGDGDGRRGRGKPREFAAFPLHTPRMTTYHGPALGKVWELRQQHVYTVVRGIGSTTENWPRLAAFVCEWGKAHPQRRCVWRLGMLWVGVAPTLTTGGGAFLSTTPTTARERHC